MTIVQDEIAAQIAELEQLVAPPTAPFGYGIDLDCVDDITEHLDEVDSLSALGIAQAIVRRLSTPRGALADDPAYGFDLRSFCNRGTPSADLPQLAGLVRNEVTEDDRVADAEVEVVYAGEQLRVEVTLTPEDPNLAEFALTLAVTSGAVLIEALS